jgi:hypothetical protein
MEDAETGVEEKTTEPSSKKRKNDKAEMSARKAKRAKIPEVAAFQWKLEFSNAQILKNIIEIQHSAHFEDTVWFFQRNQIKCVAIDSCHVSMMVMYIQTCAPHIVYTPPTIDDDEKAPVYRIKTEAIRTFVKPLSAADRVVWYAQPIQPTASDDDDEPTLDKLDLQIETEQGQTKHCRFNLMTVDDDDKAIGDQVSRVDKENPPVNMHSFTMSSTMWRQYITSVKESNQVVMSIQPDALVLESKTDFGDSVNSFTVESKLITTECPGACVLKKRFSTKYMILYSNGTAADDHVMMCVSEKRPLWIKYNFTMTDDNNQKSTFGSLDNNQKSTFGSLQYYLAPMTDDME